MGETQYPKYEEPPRDPNMWRALIDGLSESKATKEDAAWVRTWFAEALRADSPINVQYRLGAFQLGPDVEKFLWAFGEGKFRCEPKDERGRRKRAYHFLLAALLASYEFRAARTVRDELKGAGEDWWLRNRHFFLWRLLAGAVAGNIALGGSGTWLAATKAFASGWGWCSVLGASAALVVVPAWLSDAFQAPPHVSRGGQFWQRQRSVWCQGTLFVAGIAAAEWLVARKCTVAQSGWRDGKVLVLMAAVSLAIGYAVTLIWRERSIAGPV